MAQVLSEANAAAVRLALQRYVDAPDDEEELQRALRLASAEARAKAIFPELLLTSVKDLWYDVLDAKAAPGPDHARLLQRVVTMCIKEYYSP